MRYKASSACPTFSSGRQLLRRVAPSPAACSGTCEGSRAHKAAIPVHQGWATAVGPAGKHLPQATLLNTMLDEACKLSSTNECTCREKHTLSLTFWPPRKAR